MKIPALAILCTLAVPAWAQAPTPAPTAPSSGSAAAPAPPSLAAIDESLPPPEEGAKAALDRSPRHGELIDVAVPGETSPLKTWVSFPERPDQAPVVLVIHEIYGLSDWIRSVADQLAEDGFIAVAPDLLSGMGPNGGGTDSLASRDDVVKLIRALTPEKADSRIAAALAWGKALKASNGRSATLGFCWGGGRSFAFGSSHPELRAAVVYYGTSPENEALASLKVPVLGLYGGDDARVNATIDPARAEIAKLGGRYEVEIYEGAGHAFLRSQTAREGANLRAARKAWVRTLEFLRANLE